MNALDRSRQHIQEGEQLVTALRDLIVEQRAEGNPTDASEYLLRNILIHLDRLRTHCSQGMEEAS